jgi:hypothetical protein
MSTENSGDWRALLGSITRDSASMQRIIQELGVREITIKRWVDGKSEPRPQNIRRLYVALPEYRELFRKLFEEAFEKYPDLSLDEMVQEIPTQFYTHIFRMRSTISRTQRYWSIANAILNQALGQLDPDKLGMAVSVVRCMHSSKHAPLIRSLRQSVGQCTLPWPSNLEQTAMFLGAESLAGYVVTTCHPAQVHNYTEDKAAFPAHQLEGEQSAAAHPILYSGRIAGCLLFSSRQPEYFQPASRQKLVADYAHLIALAFDAAEFVDQQNLVLSLMPPLARQKAHFANFRKLLTDAKFLLHEQASDMDAEQYVWENIETQLLTRSM